jgi:hypothetical protein
MNKSVKYLMMAGAAMLAGSAVAFEQQFTDAVDTVAGNVTGGGTWSGNGTVKATSPDPYSSGLTGGAPTSSPSGNYLNVKGTVVCTNTESTYTYYKADYLVFIDEPVLELLDASEDSSLEGAQIAVAGGTEVTSGNKVALNVYCKTNATLNGWVATDANLTTGEWQRVTLMFDYGNGRCRVSVNGVPAASPYGYTSATTTSNDGGAWYVFANTPGADKITSMTFIGSGNIDEVVVAGNSGSAPAVNGSGASETVEIASGVTATVTQAELASWGVSPATIETASADDSGMTVADKLAAGLDPTDGSKFEIQSFKATSETTAQVVLPRTYAPTGYSVTYKVKVNGVEVSSTADTTVANQATITIPNLGTDVGVKMVTIETTTSDL